MTKIKPFLRYLLFGVLVTFSVVANAADPSVTIRVRQSDGTTLVSGVSASYANGSWHSFGNTDGTGTVSKSIPAGTYNFKVTYKGTSSTQSVTVSGDVMIDFYTSAVVVSVFDNAANTLDGVSLSYASGSWFGIGSTTSGSVSSQLFPGTYNFKATYRGTSATQSVNVAGNGISIGSPTIASFYTSKVDVNVSSCTGTDISGVNVSYASGSWFSTGNTDISGNISAQLFPGAYNFKATFRGTSSTQSVNVSGDGVTGNSTTSATFNPTTVTNYNTGSAYASGSWYSAYGTNYMFPGTYQFKFSGHSANITIAGCTQSFTANILILKDHNGNPLGGGHGRGGFGNNYGTWFAGGGAPTDANGVLVDVRPANNAPTTMSYEMKFNNTTSVLTQDVSQVNGNVFNFQTIELRLRLENCGGTGLSGGSARWGGGAVYGTYFFPTPNSTDANGETAAEWFPGTYSFEMGYQSTTNVKSSVTIPNSNTLLTWQTANVTLSWPYDIAYGGNGDSRFFNKPGMELLPGIVNFNFRSPNGNNYTPITISGCNMSLTGGIVRLINSDGAPLSGGSVNGYQGGWSDYGTTDANGSLFLLGKNPTSLSMTYVGGQEQKNGINFTTTPIVTYQTRVVTMELKDHDGNYTLNSDANGLWYYAGSWRAFGSGKTTDGKETMEMLPVSYSFTLYYQGGSQQISNQNVSTNALVSFQTAVANMHLSDNVGNPISGGSAYYYAGGWHTIGTTDANGLATIELLPVNYSFSMAYGGKSNQQNGIAVPANMHFVYDGSSISYNAPNNVNNLTRRMVSPNSSTIEELVVSNQVKTFPNPAGDQVRITFSSNQSKSSEIMVTDLLGRIVIRKPIAIVKGQNNYLINVGKLPNGVYPLMIGNSKSGKSKIVIMH